MKTTITITINSDQQVYDILNKTWLTGRSREGLTPEMISTITATKDDEDLNQIKRSCMESVVTLKAYLAKYIEESKTAGNNTLSFGATVLTLKMPSNFNTAMTEPIAQICHKYITAKVCYDWFMITKPDEAAPYLTEQNNAYAEFIQAVSKRKRPTEVQAFGDSTEENETT